MSLLPILYSNWWEDLKKPHSLFDQHFGLPVDVDDLPISNILPPLDSDVLVLRPRRHGLRRHPYERSLSRKTDRNSGVSTIEADKDKFQVTLDVQQFAPEEMTITVSGNNVIVEGKHEEKQDEHGWISRQFSRKYLIPEQCNIDELKSSLSSDGVLTITAPRKDLDPKSKNERVIQIEVTGKPAIKDSTKPIETQKEASPQKNSVQRRSQDQTVKAA
nr:protein lethal(2)essential for life-like [Nomia melanderi]